MDYKSILTVYGPGGLENSALEGAVSFAQAHDAHLEVLTLGVDVATPGYYYAGANALIEQQAIERARAEAEARRDEAAQALDGRPLRWTAEAAVVQIGTVQHLIASHARFADLVVLGRPYGTGRNSIDEAVVEAALFAGGVPVMILPKGDTAATDLRRVVIAWNQSPESMGAVRSAIPILERADIVDICIIDPPRHGPDRADPGGMLSTMLSRHGIRTEVSVIASTMPSKADVLMRHCEDKEADMLVMGAYGHSRLREAILGGATRDMLERARLPVLMHH